jgi:hypothetical protein
MLPTGASNFTVSVYNMTNFTSWKLGSAYRIYRESYKFKILNRNKNSYKISKDNIFCSCHNFAHREIQFINLRAFQQKKKKKKKRFICTKRFKVYANYNLIWSQALGELHVFHHKISCRPSIYDI